MAISPNLCASREIYSETVDFNQDGIPDRLIAIEQQETVQTVVEMDGYSDPAQENRTVLSEEKKCEPKNIYSSNFCSRFFAKKQFYSIQNRPNLSLIFSNLFQGVSSFIRSNCPIPLMNPLLQCLSGLDRLNEVNRSDLDLLSHSNQSQGSFRTVRQRQGMIIDTQQHPDMALYTFYATKCVILMVAVKSNRQETVRVGLAHIDNTINANGVRKFFDELTTGINNPALEVSVISGMESIALMTLQVIDERNYPLKFFNADLEGDRMDASLIDSQGKIYYGALKFYTGRRGNDYSKTYKISDDEYLLLKFIDPFSKENGELDIRINALDIKVPRLMFDIF